MQTKGFNSWLVGMALVVQSVAASAALITYDLNLLIGGGPPVTPTASWGTVTIQDTEDATAGAIANGVRIRIDVTGGSKVGELDLNFGPTPTPTFTWSSILGGAVTSVTSYTPPPGAKADGYKGLFDIAVLFNTSGNPNEPIEFDLFSTGLDLAPGDFNFFDTPVVGKGGGETIVGIHIQSCDGTRDDCPSGNSIWIGSNDVLEGPEPPPPAPPVVPEPSTVALLGLGLAALALLRRRRH